MKKEIKMNIRTDSLNAEKLVNFLEKYELVGILGDTPQEHYIGTCDFPKTCRFCKKTESDVTFRNKPHVMPQFVGNHHLLSYFECDECNLMFSKYEDSFANFIGINRTTARIKGKSKKIPKFKDPKTKMKFEIKDESILHFSFFEGSDVFSIDDEQKTASIKYTQPSYTPIHIAKILLKIGLSALQESDLSEFDSLRHIITTSDDKQGHLKGSDMLKILAYVVPGPPMYESPFVQVFKKKKLNNYGLKIHRLLYDYKSCECRL